MQPDHVIDSVTTDVSTNLRQRPGQPDAVDLWEASLSLGFPAALWRLPNKRDKHLIVSFDDVLPRVSADLEEIPAGFLVSPFNNLDTGIDGPAALTLFIRADVQATFFEKGAADITMKPGQE